MVVKTDLCYIGNQSNSIILYSYNNRWLKNLFKHMLDVKCFFFCLIYQTAKIFNILEAWPQISWFWSNFILDFRQSRSLIISSVEYVIKRKHRNTNLPFENPHNSHRTINSVHSCCQSPRSSRLIIRKTSGFLSVKFFNLFRFKLLRNPRTVLKWGHLWEHCSGYLFVHMPGRFFRH